MKITENTFIEILGLPEWDERVLEVLDALELERPTVKKGEVYAYLSSKKYGIELIFDYDCISPLQKELEADRNLYVSQITLNIPTILPLPFGISNEDNCQDIIKKIGKEMDTLKEYLDETCEWEFIKEDGTPYTLYTVFESEKLINLQNIWMRVQLPLNSL